MLLTMLPFCSAYLTPSHYITSYATGVIRTRVHRSFFPAQDASQFSQSRAPLKTTTTFSSSVLDSEMNESLCKSVNETETQQDQFEQVLSSPKLMDRAVMLDATICNVTEVVIETAASNALVGDASVLIIANKNDDKNKINTQQHVFSISHDDDLDLTRQIIMQHFEQISQSEEGTLHWILDDDDDDEIDDTVEKSGVQHEQKDALVATVAAAAAKEAEVSDDTVATASPSVPLSTAVSPIEREINAPSVAKILKYTIPAIGVWLCSPVLSMIDTSSVGLLSGTTQQAALNPAVSVTDCGALVVAFMYTATTNLIAAAQAQDQDNGEHIGAPRTTLTLVTALKLALFVGSVFGIGLSFFGKTFIQTQIGNDALDPAVIAAALRYVRIRCLGMPAAVVIGTAQSACLGMQDVKSPLYVLLAAAVINFCGDLLLVPNANLWLGGAAGAAWATVLSQYGALVMFWRWMTTRPKEGVHKEKGFKLKLSKGILQSNSESLRAKKDRPTEVKSSPKSRGFLADGKLNLRDFLSVWKVDVPTAKEFTPFVIPVTTTAIGRVSGYIVMSHVASSTLGTFDMAAHQIIFSIALCLIPIVDALSQVAQSFVPSIHGIKAKSEARANALRTTINNFRKVGACFGLILVALVSMIPLISRFFTSDPLVMQRVNDAIPGVASFLSVCGLMCGMEGSLLGQKDLVFLRNSYALFTFTVPAYMLRLKHRALAGLQTVGLGTMWEAFAVYNVIRTTFWHVRLAQLQRRTNKEVQ